MLDDEYTMQVMASCKRVPVSSVDAVAARDRLGAAAYLTCSALTRTGLDALMDAVVRNAVVGVNASTSGSSRRRSTCLLL